MNIKKLALASMTSAALVCLPSVTSSAQAAVLGGSSTCSSATFSYLDCAGSFAGNDKGNQGTGLENLNTLFGGEWSFEGDNESGLVNFLGSGSKSGQASTSLTGAGAIAVKAGNSYSLYTVADLASFDWSTDGVDLNKNGKARAISHLSVYRQVQGVPEPETQEVPEPSLLLGMIGLVSIGARYRRS